MQQLYEGTDLGHAVPKDLSTVSNSDLVTPDL